MAYIFEFIPGEKAIQLGQEQVIRALPFGPNWTRLRISVLFSINGTSGFAAGRTLYAGVCTGAKAVYDTDCIDALYSGCFGDSTASSYNASGYITTGGSGYSTGPFQKVGDTSQMFTNTLVFSAMKVAAPPSLYRTLNMWDFIKNTDGTMSYYGYYFSTLTDTARAAYTLAVEATTTPTGMASANQSAACPLRTVKDWNAAFFSWNLSVPTVNVYAFTVTRFA